MQDTTVPRLPYASDSGAVHNIAIPAQYILRPLYPVCRDEEDDLLARVRRPRSDRVGLIGWPEWPDRTDDPRLESPEISLRIRPVARGRVPGQSR